MRKPRRRWLQFSLRTLLLLVVPVACASVWVGNEIAKGKRQVAAIEWVEGQGGRVFYDGHSAPPWQRKLLGEWYPFRVTHTDLSGTDISDVKPLEALTSMQALLLRDTRTNDLEPLARLHELRFLDITDTPADSASIDALRVASPQLSIWRQPPRAIKEGEYTFDDGRVIQAPRMIPICVAEGNVRYGNEGENPLILPVEDGVITAESTRLVRYQSDHTEVWSLPLNGNEPTWEYVCAWEFGHFELPGGNLIIHSYELIDDDLIYVRCIAPDTGVLAWMVTSNAVPRVFRRDLHQVVIDRRENTLVLLSMGKQGKHLELLHAETGERLGFWWFTSP